TALFSVTRGRRVLHSYPTRRSSDLLSRNIWRKFQYQIDSTGMYSPTSSVPLNVGAVNIEENDQRLPLPYRTPREIERVQTLSNKDRKSTRLNSSHVKISYAVFCLKK